MISDGTIDYSKPSLEDLYRIRDKIDGDSYPINYRNLLAEIERRESQIPPSHRFSAKETRQPMSAVAVVLIGCAVVIGGAILLAAGLQLLVGLGMKRGFDNRDEVARSVGSFTFVESNRAVARLRARHGPYWEFDFVDPNALTEIGDRQVEVTFVNRGRHPIEVKWDEVLPGEDFAQRRESLLPAGKSLRFWSGEYGKYHDSNAQLIFADESWFKRYDIEIVLLFQKPVPGGVRIKPYVNTPVM